MLLYAFSLVPPFPPLPLCPYPQGSRPTVTKHLNNINKYRLSFQLRRRSLSNLALIAVGCGRAFLPFIGANNGLRRFQTEISESEWQFVLAGPRSRKISSGSSDYNPSITTERACLDMFRFNQRSLEKIIALLLHPVTKGRTAYNGYAITPTLAKCVIIPCLSTTKLVQY